VNIKKLIREELELSNIVEAEKSKVDPKKEKILKSKFKYKTKDGKQKEISVAGALKQGKKHPAYKTALSKVKSKKKSIDKKSNTENDKIKNSVIKAHDKKSGKKIEVKVDDVLSLPFGSAKKMDDSKPGTKEAKKFVYNVKKKEAESKAKKEVNARKKKNKGKFKLTKDEQVEFKAWKEDNPFVDEDTTEEDWFKTQKPIEQVSAFDPVDGEQWEDDDPFGDGDEGDDWGFGDDDDDDWGDDFGDSKTDDYGNPLSTRGNKKQQNALELKMRLGIGNTKKQTKSKNHIVTREDGTPVALSVFKDKKTNKYYGVDDEGNIYENDTDDFTKTKQPTTDMRGFEGAITKKGQTDIEKREGRPEKQDDYDKTTFADLLGILGIETDIDWKDPFGQ